MFDTGIISNACQYKDKVVGLPVSLYFSTLYSNTRLLSLYDREIPKTWDELIET
eukprot:jgi/Orpsp1_1/1191409/evm.model.d7180000085554.1